MSDITTFINALVEKPILVFGLGRSGLSTVKALKTAGAHVVVADDNPQNLEAVKHMDVEILGEMECDFSHFAFLVLSPGVPLTHPKPHDIVVKAHAAGLEIICDIELFHRIYPAQQTIGITGTNGKSTTTSLIHHILKSAGLKASIAGNIGTPIFDLNRHDPASWLVLEISSFQMDLCPTYRPDIAVILNITPDHIDRHGTIEHYTAVKARIIAPNKESTYNSAIMCSDDHYTQEIYKGAKTLAARAVTEVSTVKSLPDGVSAVNALLQEGATLIGDLSTIPSLKGVHNDQNAACAYAVARQIGVERTQIWHAMQDFAGLNHRQYLVRTINGVGYVNDSKATNAASSAVALGCRNNVYWIVGGRKKQTALDGLESFFPRLKHAFLIGESTEDFATWFDQYGIDYTRSYQLESAVNSAHKMAQDNRGQPGGGVVLLSPACASFDQFRSFEERGDSFTALVQALEA